MLEKASHDAQSEQRRSGMDTAELARILVGSTHNGEEVGMVYYSQGFEWKPGNPGVLSLIGVQKIEASTPEGFDLQADLNEPVDISLRVEESLEISL